MASLMKDRPGPKTSRDYTIDKAHEEHAEGVHPLVIAARLGRFDLDENELARYFVAAHPPTPALKD